MLLDDLILELQKARAEVGNLRVVVDGGHTTFDPEVVLIKHRSGDTIGILRAAPHKKGEGREEL